MDIVEIIIYIIMLIFMGLGIWYGFFQYDLCINEGMSSMYCFKHAFG